MPSTGNALFRSIALQIGWSKTAICVRGRRGIHLGIHAPTKTAARKTARGPPSCHTEASHTRAENVRTQRPHPVKPRRKRLGTDGRSHRRSTKRPHASPRGRTRAAACATGTPLARRGGEGPRGAHTPRGTRWTASVRGFGARDRRRIARQWRARQPSGVHDSAVLYRPTATMRWQRAGRYTGNMRDAASARDGREVAIGNMCTRVPQQRLESGTYGLYALEVGPLQACAAGAAGQFVIRIRITARSLVGPSPFESVYSPVRSVRARGGGFVQHARNTRLRRSARSTKHGGSR